jgi:hypothetical protein
VRKTCDELWNMTLINEFGDYLSDDYSTQLIYKTGLSSKHSKICPICIAQKKYEQKLWDLNINIVCNEHNILLINECPKCYNLISSIRDNILFCNCGFPLRALPIMQPHKHLIEISRLLHQSSLPKPASSLNFNPLYNLSLKNIVSLLTFFSKQLTIHFDYVKFSNKLSTRDEDYQQILVDAFNIFMNWPHNYYFFLNNIRNSRLDKKGSRLQLSGVYIGIHRKFTSPEFSFLREEFYNYMREDINRDYKIVSRKFHYRKSQIS